MVTVGSFLYTVWVGGILQRDTAISAVNILVLPAVTRVLPFPLFRTHEGHPPSLARSLLEDMTWPEVITN